jgi:tight adherence protein C
MPEIGLNSWWIFATAISVALLLLVALGGGKNKLDERLRQVSGKERAAPALDPFSQFARQTLPTMGKALMPTNAKERTVLQTRLLHAGLYHRQAMVFFLGVKLLLIIGPAFTGITLGLLGVVKLQTGLILGIVAGIIGLIGPSFWLDRRKAARQTSLRRALPDALDVMVICLEGGLSMSAAIRRVAGELRTAHPLLASELNIVQREMQLGKAPGEALAHFADRVDLEEVRSLAQVITQSERFGASLVKSLRVHAEVLRTKRLQYAEEAAQKASVKVLFPTLLCIFPGLFLAILGPAVIQIVALFRSFTR